MKIGHCVSRPRNPGNPCRLVATASYFLAKAQQRSYQPVGKPPIASHCDLAYAMACGDRLVGPQFGRELKFSFDHLSQFLPVRNLQRKGPLLAHTDFFHAVTGAVAEVVGI